MRLGAVGELGLISKLAAVLGPAGEGVAVGIGDDAAVLAPAPGSHLLASTDMLVEGVHFNLAWLSPRELGKRILAPNLSDIAAMGGRPRWALVTLALRPDLEVEFLEEMYRGMQELADEFKVGIVGGDTCRLPERLAVDVAILGEVAPGRAILRSGAAPGDLLVVTGSLGVAAAGLAWLGGAGATPTGGVPAGALARVLAAHRTPRPRVREGQFLAGDGRITAMDDISDGLATETREMARASRVGMLVEGDRVPISTATAAVAAALGADPLDLALYGGEDFELLCAFRGSEAEALDLGARLVQATGTGLSVIGRVLPAGEGVKLVLPGGDPIPFPEGGYDHFG